MSDDRRRYRKAYLRLWANPDFLRFPDGEKVMTQYLLFGPQTNRLGLFRVSPGLGVEQLNCSLKVFRTREAHVCETFGWSFDDAAKVLWIPSWWDYNDVHGNVKVMQGALADLNEVPETILIDKFLTHWDFVPIGLQGLFTDLSARRAIPRKIFIPGTQDQDQEQKQEQKQEQESVSSEVNSEPTTQPAAAMREDSPPDASLAALVFPTVGSGGKTWALTDRQISEWQRLFPSLDILDQMRRALAWLQANPGRQKTSKGMLRFLVGWLTRAVDYGHSATRPALVTGSLKTAGNDAALASFVARHRRTS